MRRRAPQRRTCPGSPPHPARAPRRQRCAGSGRGRLRLAWPAPAANASAVVCAGRRGRGGRGYGVVSAPGGCAEHQRKRRKGRVKQLGDGTAVPVAAGVEPEGWCDARCCPWPEPRLPEPQQRPPRSVLHRRAKFYGFYGLRRTSATFCSTIRACVRASEMRRARLVRRGGVRVTGHLGLEGSGRNALREDAAGRQQLLDRGPRPCRRQPARQPRLRVCVSGSALRGDAGTGG